MLCDVSIFGNDDHPQDINSFFFMAGVLQSQGFSNLFSFGVDLDAKNPGINIAQFGQGVYALPSRDLYLDKSTSSQQLRQQYFQHITLMFTLAGMTNESAATAAANALQFETCKSFPSLSLELPFSSLFPLPFPFVHSRHPSSPLLPPSRLLSSPPLPSFSPPSLSRRLSSTPHTVLANASLPDDQLIDPFTTYNKLGMYVSFIFT